MALHLHASPNWKYISVRLQYAVPMTVTLEIVDAEDNDISGSVNPSFTITSTSGPIKYPIPVSNLSITNGLITVKAIEQTTTGSSELDQKSVILHCDIDCCLTKLTNELIECACDCAKCSTSLAKAQKVFLLIQSADYAIIQANDAPSGTESGFLQDSNDKYLKAKEICDESCGCNC